MILRKTDLFQIIAVIGLAAALFIGCSASSDKIPITTNSKEAKDLYLKGLSLSDRFRTNESIEYFEKAIDIDSEFAMAYLNLAFVHPTPSEFFPDFNKAVSLKQNISEGEKLWIEATEAAVNNQQQTQIDILKKLVRLYPKDERAFTNLANSYFGQQDYTNAIKYYLEAMDINPEFSPIYNLLGYSYRFLKNYSEAEVMFKKYIELIPNDPNPYDSYAELLLETGKFDESIKYYEKALKINPYFVLSYLGIATNLNLKEEHVKARNRLQELLLAARDNNQKRIAHNGIAISYIDEGYLKAGAKEYYKMLELSTSSHDTALMINDYFTLGYIFREMNDFEKSKEMYNKALDLAVNNNISEQIKTNTQINYLANLAQIETKEHNFNSAKENASQYREYAETQKNENMIRFANQIEGIIALEENNFELAIELLRQANQRNPYNLYRLGLAYQGLNDFEKAKSFYSKAAESNSLSNINYAVIRKKAIIKAEMTP